jgi:uncharacterized protein YukE
MAQPVSLAFKIAANLSDFRAAMGDLQNQLATTKSAMSRMANSFDGSSLIANGNAMVKVVTDLGGASMLTESEAAKVNATLNETLAKYQALGREAPPGMQALANATAGANKETTDWYGSITQLAATFGVAFSAGALISFGEKVVETGAHVQEMATRLGISTDAVQGFQFAAEQGGASRMPSGPRSPRWKRISGRATRRRSRR